MMSSNTNVSALVNDVISRRRSLKVAVASLCSEVGFGSARDSALETLTEMMQSFMTELAHSAQGYCELSGRTIPLPSDIIISLVDMGINVDSIPNHALRINRSVVSPPSTAADANPVKALEIGEKKLHPPHIPDHFPSFPDPHTYIRTLTHRQNVNEYRVAREKGASQKRDVERALTRFIAKTGQVQSVLKDDVNAFPLIAVKPEALPYMTALMPQDYDVDASYSAEDTSSYFIDFAQGPTNDSDIDNPYIRPVKMPRLNKQTTLSP